MALSITGALMAWNSATSKYSELQGTCGDAPPCSEGQIDSVKTRVRIANVLCVVAGTAAAFTGVVLYLDHLKSSVSVALRF
jgi:hypothetical protein